MVEHRPRIGLLGGSFDPVHRAHLALAHAALEQLQLDEVRWIPVGQPWWKPDVQLAPPEHRAAMVALAIRDEPRFVLDTIEIERGGPTYTLDTARALRRQRPEARWTLILGRDQYASLPSWHGFEALAGLVEFAVADRPDAAVAVHAIPFRPIVLPPMAVSSTAVRHAVAAGTDIAQLVPDGVARYIESHGLYRRPTRS
jgi:nicotinate-nucleotide adenylyltransferase